MFEVGCVLNGRYRIVRLIGAGGMARVYEVENLKLPSRAALKVLNRPPSGTEDLLRRFRREAEIQAKLNHPNLVRVFDWDVTPDQNPYLIMELLPGEDLAQRLRRDGVLSLPVAVSIFSQTAAALQHAHAHGIIHRDLKPGNIFLLSDSLIPNHVKVLDFGIAKITGHSGQADTQDGSMLGTPGYMAPEHIRGNTLEIGPRSDQWALGLVLYEMLSGHPAFYRSGDEIFQTYYRILSTEPDPLPNSAMHRAIMRALSKEPSERYPGLSEFVAAVQECVPHALYLPVLPAQTARWPEDEPRRRNQTSVRALSSLLATGLGLQTAAGETATLSAVEADGQQRSPRGTRRITHHALPFSVMLAFAAVGLALLVRIPARSLPLLAGGPLLHHVPTSLRLPPSPGAAVALPAEPGRVVASASGPDREQSMSVMLPASKSQSTAAGLAPVPRLEEGANALGEAALSPPALSLPRLTRGPTVTGWKLRVVDGLSDQSPVAARLGTCLRRSGVLDARDTPWRKSGRGRFVLLNQGGVLILDPSLNVPGATRQRANDCLDAISRRIVMLPEQISMSVCSG